MQKVTVKRAAASGKAQWVLGGLVIASVSVMLIAIFGLANWAEAARWHHAMQHVLIFTAGTGCGSSLILIAVGRGDSHES